MATTLYRVFDAEGRLLYVGVSDGVFIRLGEHAANSPWVTYAVRITLEEYATRVEAEAAEAQAILTEDPVWNMKGRPPKRFLQWMRAYPHGNPDDVDVGDLIRRTRHLIGTNNNPHNQGETQS